MYASVQANIVSFCLGCYRASFISLTALELYYSIDLAYIIRSYTGPKLIAVLRASFIYPWQIQLSYRIRASFYLNTHTLSLSWAIDCTIRFTLFFCEAADDGKKAYRYLHVHKEKQQAESWDYIGETSYIRCWLVFRHRLTRFLKSLSL